MRLRIWLGPTALVLLAFAAAAIAAHDEIRLRPLFDDDYHGIQGTFVTYRRDAETIEIAQSDRPIAEYGHWLGSWRKADGTMRETGRYLAAWTISKGQWRLRCSGSKECQTAG